MGGSLARGAEAAWALRVLLALTLPLLASVLPAAAKPRVPIGIDPGGVAVAIIGPGVDYTRPEIAARLARDGEGEAIAWDFQDMDRAPYEPPLADGAMGPGTAAASALISQPGPKMRLLPLRPTSNPLAIGASARFLAQSPARIAVVMLGTLDRQDWQAFAEIAGRQSGLLLVVAAGDEAADLDASPRFPAALGLPNVIVVSACDASGKPLAGANTGAKTVDILSPVQAAAAAASHDGKLVTATATAIAAADVARLAANYSALGSGAALKDYILKSAALPAERLTPESRAASRLGCIRSPQSVMGSNKF